MTTEYPHKLFPSARISVELIPPKTTTKASHPWSKSNPKGVELPVFRACFPSILSQCFFVRGVKFFFKNIKNFFETPFKNLNYEIAEKANKNCPSEPLRNFMSEIVSCVPKGNKMRYEYEKEPNEGD